jgi:hypothetical protein
MEQLLWCNNVDLPAEAAEGEVKREGLDMEGEEILLPHEFKDKEETCEE